MGGFCTPSYTELPDAKNIVEGTEIPEWVAAAGREIFTSATGIAGSDYPIYQGERTATFDGSTLTEDERLGMQMLREGSQDYLSYINRAADVANTLGGGYDSMSRQELLGDEFQASSDANLMGQYQGATREELLGQGVDPFSMENAQEYMDIYQQSMNPAIREIEEQTIRAQNQARESAARSGAFGGSRLGILEGTAAGEGAKAAGDLRATAGREGLDFAAGRFDTERANRFSAENALRSAYETEEAAKAGQMDAYATAGTLAADLQAQTAQGLITSGEATRLLDQRALDLAYADYLDQRDYPQEQLNFALGALSQTPYSTVSRGYQTGTEMAADPSVYGQTLSGLGSLYSAYKLYNS